ncbi:glycerate kinase [Sphaerisporangium siamense]|uniref:Glycerate kinase n=1 Tax=Sphaerisporangium siamense TaxID=795645 RepID=A0A7W7G936_9ACTN|nr:glycerate kinase [Sphaerisporangium siamense]MBB4700165.1 glycerate kinase [Sphaerisporangium siamense]GII84521.1 glycerate kinase [Sphaerisporangium siamense]
MTGTTAGHVVVAPDKFRGSLTSPEVAAHVAAGLRSARREHVVLLPIADGGDGTVDAVVASGFTRLETHVTGPVGERVLAAYAVRDEPDGRVAVIELAEASGLRRLSEAAASAPLTATSRGTGELVAHAVRHGATRIVLGLGGSACTDGGAGMAQALGVRLLDAAGNDLPPGGAALRDLHAIDVSGRLRGFEVVVASDVDNPLLGPYGAAAVYGPQKGATPEDVAVLEAGLARLAAVAAHASGLPGAVEHSHGLPGVAEEGRAGRAMGVAGRPGAGAAGGVGFGALAFLHAEIRPGIGYLLDLLDFDRHVAGARLVITGEGSIDAQTLRGKAPVGVAAAAAAHGVPVVAVCGRRSVGDEELRAAGIEAAYALTDVESDVRRCMAEAGPLLERLAGRIAAAFLSP